MNTDFETLTALRDEWQALQPLSAENEARLWKKLRLEWNYHSNHIEGNTLTYGETELLLLHDRTTGNHSHREYLEMKAHDLGIEHVRALAADKERLLTESDIRDLNRIILKEPFWKPAETPDGQPTRTEIIPGQYKTSPNNVRLPDGSMFYFASVEDTPPKMQALAGWLRRELETPTLHPVTLAAKLHHDFVLIHPFGDGNGRVARLLVNYVLMRHGFLPLIVRTEDKANYLTALQLADAGELSALIAYFHQLTEWSLNLGIKAAKGESIEEPSDVEKEIAIFAKNQPLSTGERPPRTPIVVKHLLAESIVPFFRLLTEKMRSLNVLFGQSENTGQLATAILRYQMNEMAWGTAKPVTVPEHVEEIFSYYGYKGTSAVPFDVSFPVRVVFDPDQYVVICEGQKIMSLSYNRLLVGPEAEQVCAEILSLAFAQIKNLSGTKE